MWLGCVAERVGRRAGCERNRIEVRRISIFAWRCGHCVPPTQAFYGRGPPRRTPISTAEAAERRTINWSGHYCACGHARKLSCRCVLRRLRENASHKCRSELGSKEADELAISFHSEVERCPRATHCCFSSAWPPPTRCGIVAPPTKYTATDDFLYLRGGAAQPQSLAAPPGRAWLTCSMAPLPRQPAPRARAVRAARAAAAACHQGGIDRRPRPQQPR